MSDFRRFCGQKVSGVSWRPFDSASGQCRLRFVDDWEMYRTPRSLDEIEVLRHCQSAQLETAPTKHGERKCLFIFIIHYKWKSQKHCFCSWFCCHRTFLPSRRNINPSSIEIDKFKRNFTGHKGVLFSIVFSPDGDMLAKMYWHLYEARPPYSPINPNRRGEVSSPKPDFIRGHHHWLMNSSAHNFRRWATCTVPTCRDWFAPSDHNLPTRGTELLDLWRSNRMPINHTQKAIKVHNIQPPSGRQVL